MSFVKNILNASGRALRTAFLGMLLASIGIVLSGQIASAQPNVVVFLTDDMGWTDWQYDAALNPNGSIVYETPNLIQLAQQSVVFKNAYSSAPICSPSRASILTGKAPARTTMTNFLPGNPNTTTNLKEPLVWQRNLAGSEVTLAESFKAAGYSTGFFGKWHLGSNPGSGIDPTQNGFDVNIGGNGSGGPETAGGYFAGADGAWVGLPGLDTPGTYPSGTYLSDAVGAKVGDFIQQHAGGPFFIADWDYLVHIPTEAPANLVSKYQTKINTLQGQGANLKGHTNATYAGMMEMLDNSVGALLDHLDDPNGDNNTSDSIRDNTIIVFASDNGGLYGAEGSPTRNLPLREGKGSMYEGGIRVPQMISWTGNNAIGQGVLTTARTSSEDLYPTLLDLAGLWTNPSIPKNATVDGVNIRTALEGGVFDRGNLFWHYPHRSNQDLGSGLINGGSFVSAVSDGAWKLLFFYGDRHYELYNLNSDLGEATNLLAFNPEIARNLSLALRNYLTSTSALMPVCNTTTPGNSAGCTVFNAPVDLPTLLSAPTPGDYNGDSVVNAADYNLWRSEFGSTTHLAADGNGNGVVDTADYVFWRNIFQGLGSGNGGGAVPEPGTALLILLGLLAVAFPARHRGN